MTHPIYKGYEDDKDGHIDKTKGTTSASLAIRPDATAVKGPVTRDMESKVKESDKHYKIAEDSYKGTHGYGPNIGTVMEGDMDNLTSRIDNIPTTQEGSMTKVIRKNQAMHDSLTKVSKENK